MLLSQEIFVKTSGSTAFVLLQRRSWIFSTFRSTSRTRDRSERGILYLHRKIQTQDCSSGRDFYKKELFLYYRIIFDDHSRRWGKECKTRSLWILTVLQEPDNATGTRMPGNDFKTCTVQVLDSTIRTQVLQPWESPEMASVEIYCNIPAYTLFVPKVSVLIFYLNVYWTHLKLQVISLKVWPLGSYTVVPTLFPLIITVLEVIFRKCV